MLLRHRSEKSAHRAILVWECRDRSPIRSVGTLLLSQKKKRKRCLPRGRRYKGRTEHVEEARSGESLGRTRDRKERAKDVDVTGSLTARQLWVCISALA